MIARLPAGSVQRFKVAKIDPVPPLYLPWVPEDIFFLIDTDGLFHIRYFENGPLEPGYFVPHSLIGKNIFAMGKPTRGTKNEFRL